MTHLETGVSSLIFQYSSPGRVEEGTQYWGEETEVDTFLYLNLQIEQRVRTIVDHGKCFRFLELK